MQDSEKEHSPPTKERRSDSEACFNMQNTEKEYNPPPKEGRSVSEACFNMQDIKKELSPSVKEGRSVSEPCFNMQGSMKVKVVPQLGVVGECEEVRENILNGNGSEAEMLIDKYYNLLDF